MVKNTIAKITPIMPVPHYPWEIIHQQILFDREQSGYDSETEDQKEIAESKKKTTERFQKFAAKKAQRGG